MARSKSNGNLGGGCLALFGMPFLLAGLFLGWLYFSGYAEWWRARSWQEVPCRIESAELKGSRDGDPDTHKAEATYRYFFGGLEYQGDRLTFGKGSDNIGSFQEDAYRELAAHVSKDVEAKASFRCFVDPKNPSQAVLYRNLRWPMQAFMAVFALTFPAVGAILVAAGLFHVISARKEAALVICHPDEPWRWKAAWAGTQIPDRSGMWTTVIYSHHLVRHGDLFPDRSYGHLRCFPAGTEFGASGDIRDPLVRPRFPVLAEYPEAVHHRTTDSRVGFRARISRWLPRGCHCSWQTVADAGRWCEDHGEMPSPGQHFE